MKEEQPCRGATVILWNIRGAEQDAKLVEDVDQDKAEHIDIVGIDDLDMYLKEPSL